MKKEFVKVFQIAAVFIGTIVGAGLASGKEITQFFTSYGYKSFIGIILCGIFYICMCSIISRISIRYNLNSYSELINIVSPNFLGKITGFITTFYLVSSASIILAGSGAIMNQFFGIPKIIGTLIMATLALLTLMKETSGLIEINSLIVPSLIIVTSTILILYLMFYRDIITLDHMKNLGAKKDEWWLSTILYAGYNILCCSGVLVPLSTEMKKTKTMILGITLGSIGLTILCLFINLMLMLNQPYIYQYEIPLLYITNRFGKLMQLMLLIIIWLEMFSTEVSDVYSISKTLDRTFKLKYKYGIFLVIVIALPISQIGFTNLISTLYPIFGALSLFFICQCICFYIYKMK
ncbi:transporter [Clostridium polyendosporum]|uniref:Transporter n=1 Tax=Clostridium polyendosporum TaxID=69208 RepID=A0A919S0D3_9CLOT|nr:transporter [Clostridium polyendosporum]GIM28991.1 transporter [Clostridium polyendosporum]